MNILTKKDVKNPPEISLSCYKKNGFSKKALELLECSKL